MQCKSMYTWSGLCLNLCLKPGEGIEMEMYFHVRANSPNRARKQAEKWYWNLVNKNPSLRLMYTTEMILLVRGDIE